MIDFAILLLMYTDLFTPPDFTELKGMRPIRLVRLLRRLSDQRQLAAADLAGFSADARATLQDWAAAGWLQAS